MILFGLSSSGQPICFDLDGISYSPEGVLRLIEVHPDKALISDADLSLRFSNTGFVTGRQALTTPSVVSRHVKSVISACLSARFSGVMLVVTWIRTRVMTQILYQMLAFRESSPVSSREKSRVEQVYPHVIPMENSPLKMTFLPVGI